MKNLEFDKPFFEKVFSEARMRPYFDHYPGNEKKAVLHYEQNIRLSSRNNQLEPNPAFIPA